MCSKPNPFIDREICKKVITLTVKGTSSALVKSAFLSTSSMDAEGCAEAKEKAVSDQERSCHGDKTVKSVSECRKRYSGGTYTYQVSVIFSCAAP